VAVRGSVLQCVVVLCSVVSVWQCVILRIVLKFVPWKCVAVRCSVLQCVAVCSSVVQCVAECYVAHCFKVCSVEVCRSALQCVAVLCSVVQCVAV